MMFKPQLKVAVGRLRPSKVNAANNAQPAEFPPGRRVSAISAQQACRHQLAWPPCLPPLGAHWAE
eukprot:scaffold15678_cov39-Phaeocystis_antarctica.AAC.3